MIVYQLGAEGIEPPDLDGFFVGWRDPPTPETHLRVLQESAFAVLALDGRQVVGFVYAITDGLLSAYIPLIEVLPANQGHGIGDQLMRRLLAQLDAFYMVDASCDVGLAPFYERFGMRRGVAMTLRNYGVQQG